MNQHKLRLFVTGHTPVSKRAIDNLQEFCEFYLKAQYELKIIDVLEQPELAEDERILATPTVIKDTPLPVMRIIGDMTDYDQIIKALSIDTRERGIK